MINSNISWTNDTWNPWQGCHKVSAGCDNCYMYREKKRWGQQPGHVVRSAPATFSAPLKKLKGPLVFTCSWSDFFIEEADPWRNDAWDIIRATPHLIYQILTKRPERIASCLPDDWHSGWKNVWLGATVENAEQVARLEVFNQIGAGQLFISIEPMLTPVMTLEYFFRWFKWVIVGGESGPGARYMDPNWARIVRDQCRRYDIPFFMKQMTRNEPIPDDLMIREFPLIN